MASTSGATDVDNVRARQAAAEGKLQELEQQQQNLEQQLQQLPIAEPAWMVVQHQIASLQQQLASLQQRIAALQELEQVRQAAERRLSLAELVDKPVPSLPAIVDTSHTSERRVFPYYPDSVLQEDAYFEGKLLGFRRQLEADSMRCFTPVGVGGNPRPGVADSEGGVTMYFYQIKNKLEEVLVQQGHTDYAYVPLARVGPLSELARASSAQAAELAASGSAAAAAVAGAAVAAAVAMAPEASTAGVAGAAVVAEPADHSRRFSSSGGDGRRRKPDLVLACIPEHQQPSSSSSVPSMQYGVRKVVAFGELKVRETLTNSGAPVDLASLYMEGESRAKAVIGQAFTYMNLLQVRLGFISCYDVLWLLERREEQPKVLYISAPIMATATPPEITLMLAMCWLQLTAITDPRGALPLQPLAGSCGAGPEDGSSGRPGSGERGSGGGSGFGPEERAPGKRPSNPPGHRAGHFVTGSQLSDTGRQTDQLVGCQLLHSAASYQLPGLPPLPLLPLSWLQPAGVSLGSGATSIVLQGVFQGQECAIKLLLLDDARYWRREVAAYQHLRALQGCYLPKLLGVGLTCQGACCFLALELVRGSLVMGTSKAVAAAAVTALQQVHDLGYVHGDVRRENLMQRDTGSGTCGAVLVDLGHARPGSLQECETEMNSLRQLLHLAQ